MVGGCSVLVGWDLYVVSESAGLVVGCCGSAVVFVAVVTGGCDVVDTWGSAVEWEVCVVPTTVVGKVECV